jgi:dihydropteroate synthase
MNESFKSRLQQERPLVMGILNVTPDSFSDGGVHLDAFLARDKAMAMVGEGADLIDIGGESTRPGSLPVSPEEQCRRVLPVLDSLLSDPEEASRPYISIDTSSSHVAHEALKRGAVVVNDVTAGSGDPRMFDVVAHHRAHIVLMHMQGTPQTMQEAPQYQNVVSEVSDYLKGRIAAAVAAGIAREAIILDPGIGFGKTREHNLELLRHLDKLSALGYPVLLGCSRKRFMGSLCAEADPLALVGATVATTAFGVAKGVRLFRVHDVKPNRQAADVAWHLSRTKA